MTKRVKFCILDQESLLRTARKVLFVEASYRMTKMRWEQDQDFKDSYFGKIINVAEFITGDGSLTPGRATVEIGDPFSDPVFAHNFQNNAQAVVKNITKEITKGPAATQKF